MALTIAQRNFIEMAQDLSQALIGMEGKLDMQNTLWAGAPGYQTSIDQTAIDSDPTLTGLTAAHLADAEYALATIYSAIHNALPALSTLAAL